MAEIKEINTKINFGSQSFKKYFLNTSWLFSQRVFKLIISFAINIYVIRYLGPADFGLLSYALSFVGLFTALSSLGLDNIIIRELVNEPGKRDVLLGSTFILKLFGAVLAVILIMLTLLIIKEEKATSLLILIVSASTIFQTLNLIEFFFQAKVKVKYSAIAQVISLIISAVLKVFLILIKAPLIYFALAFTLEFLFIGIGFLIVYSAREAAVFKWKFNKQISLNMLKDAWPLTLSGLVIAVYMKIDQVMIKNMLSVQEVGYYAAAVRFTEAWYFVPTAICTSLFPSIINAKKMNSLLYTSRLQKLYDILTWLSYAIAIPLTIFSPFVVTLILGAEYLPSASVLTIYIWAGVPVSLGVASSQYLVNENFTKMAFYRTFIGMLFNIFLNLLLIPVYGIIGSAIATLVSYSMATFSIGFSRKTFGQLKMMMKSILLVDLITIIYRKFQKITSPRK